jgi:hypothetical protein
MPITAYAKAITATVLAFLGALSTALPEGVSGQEWIAIAVTTIVAGGAVWAVPNRPQPPRA